MDDVSDVEEVIQIGTNGGVIHKSELFGFCISDEVVNGGFGVGVFHAGIVRAVFHKAYVVAFRE